MTVTNQRLPLGTNHLTSSLSSVTGRKRKLVNIRRQTLKLRIRKNLFFKKREEIFDRINKLGVLYGIGFASAEEIDRYNILQATFLAMRRACQKFYLIPGAVALVDGPHPIKDFLLRQEPVIDGDAKSLNIAAASIIAKVFRDRYMNILDKLYPGYGFAGHKGYGTPKHLAAIEKLGPCPQHRKTFGPVSQFFKPTLFP